MIRSGFRVLVGAVGLLTFTVVVLALTNGENEFLGMGGEMATATATLSFRQPTTTQPPDERMNVTLARTPTPTRHVTSTPLPSPTPVISATPTATLEPIPTLTENEVAQLRSLWQSEMELAAGFSHPVFAFWADELSRGARRHVYYDHVYTRFSGSREPWEDVRDFRPELLAERVEFEGATYVAMIMPGTLSGYPARFLMFKITSDTPELLPDPIRVNVVWPSWDFAAEQDMPPFGDRNGNNLPDLVVGPMIAPNVWGCVSNYGLALVEIQPGGAVKDISPPLTDVIIAGFEDLDRDGIQELAGIESVTSPFDPDRCELILRRWYGWDGEMYREITADLGEAYFPAIFEYWSHARDKNCLPVDLSVYQMLLDYYALGRLLEVWASLLPRLEDKACVIDAHERHDLITKLAYWVETVKFQGIKKRT